MDYSSFRAEARKRLAGKWGKVVLCLFVTGLVTGLISYLPTLTKTKTNISYYGITVATVSTDNIVSVLLSYVAMVVSLVITFGLVAALWKAYNGEDIGAADGLKIAVANWKRTLMILLNVAKKLLIPLIMVVASTVLSVLVNVIAVGIICAIVALAGSIWLFVEGLHYSLVYVIAADNTSMSEADVVAKSKELMTNKRGKLVVLMLTFFGWCVLGVLSLGIGMLWVTPYMQFAFYAFYEFCKSGKAPVAEAKVEAKPEPKPEPVEEPKAEPKEEDVDPIKEN